MAKHFRFTTTEYHVPADVPRPLVFAFISDLHGCPNEPIIDAIRSLSPDAILVGGDYVHNFSLWESGIEFLRLASKIAPTFASIGNHENKAGVDVRRLVPESGAMLLDDASAHLAGIEIGGLTSAVDLPGGDCVPNTNFLARFAAERGFKLLVCHHPEYFDRYVKPLAIDLTLSGHAHGGQWRFFGRGVYSPGQGVFPKYTCGAYDGGRLIVGRGLGNTVVVPRIFNSPELVVIRLGGSK